MKKELIVDTSSIITVSVGVGNIIRTCISQKDVSICRIIVISYILYMSILRRVVLQDLGVILVKMCVIIVLLQLYSATCRISFSYNSPFSFQTAGKETALTLQRGQILQLCAQLPSITSAIKTKTEGKFTLPGNVWVDVLNHSKHGAFCGLIRQYCK